MKRAFKWSPAPTASSASCARMASRCRRYHRRCAGRGRRWRRPTHGWAAAGISIGPHTATPEWYGEALHLTAALDVLWEPPAATVRGAS